MPKYCVLPGQPPVRLTTTQGGHVCIVGEEPREIPAIFEQEAKGKGCLTEDEVANIKNRLLSTGASQTKIQPPAPDAAAVERAEKIKAATIELINGGNPENFTSQNKPRTEVLTAMLGFEVKGAERDAAFAAASA